MKATALIYCCLALWTGTTLAVQDGEQLADRFRPYYKFSIDRGQEPCRPCSWQWFIAHADLYRGKNRLATSAQLSTTNLLTFPEADIRQAHGHFCALELRVPAGARSGQPWEDVINDGAGLYAQCEDAGDGFVVLTYWTLFAYNKTMVIGNHEGDITAVTVVYDRKRDCLVRTSYGMHGRVVASFDLDPLGPGEVTQLTGRGTDGKQLSVPAKRIRAVHDYQDGPFWHRSSIPEIYLVQDPRSGKWEHLAMFCEWGSHEPWPNPSGSFTVAPKHRGDDISFLPGRVTYLGSFDNPTGKEAPFVFFNGRWGTVPKCIIFHRSCFYPEGRANNHFKIPENQFVDRDFFDGRKLHWPPVR